MPMNLFKLPHNHLVGGAIMPIRNIVSCTRQPNRAIFSFVNLFAGCQHYRVVMDFLPSGIVNIIVGGHCTDAKQIK